MEAELPVSHLAYIALVIIGASLCSRYVNRRVFVMDDARSYVGSLLFDVALGGTTGYLLSIIISTHVLATISALTAVLLVQSKFIKALIIDNIVGEGLVNVIYGGGSRNIYNPIDDLAEARRLRIAKNYTASLEIIDRALTQQLAPEMRDAFQREKMEVQQLLEDLGWKSDQSAS